MSHVAYGKTNKAPRSRRTKQYVTPTLLLLYTPHASIVQLSRPSNRRHGPCAELPAHFRSKTIHARKDPQKSRDGARRDACSYGCRSTGQASGTRRGNAIDLARMNSRHPALGHCYCNITTNTFPFPMHKLGIVLAHRITCLRSAGIVNPPLRLH